MKVRVTIEEVKVIKRTYEIDGVNTLEAAKKCALRCANKQFQPNAWLYREVPCSPTYRLGSYEVVNPD